MYSLNSLQDYLRSKDNTTNFYTCSEIPSICKTEPCRLGVDEAGRGPVLGPMVYGIAYCPLSNETILQTLGCADSKALTEEKRDEIFTKMLTDEESLSNVGWNAEIISPKYISNSMYRRAKHSLNEVAKKADSIYPIVSAASIVAKVTRDHALKVWNFKEGLDMDSTQFGSGYPGDPLTKKFIREQIDNVFGYPLLVRFSWSTAENMLQEKAAMCTFEETDEASPNKKAAGTKSITTFFSPKEEKKSRKRHKFFEERQISMTNAFE
ncbi:ribonuclease H2 subunit A isoform X2 [Battus philenor]|uniref:ribonuclease H2 subunit A isoform X2 n=1 Tax=Battus philenor TaxID=42288 RepID=UPI0035D02C57